MKSNAQIGPACKQQAASPVCLSQESRGSGPRDNQKLTVNPRSVPACILLYHPSDEDSNFSIDFWPAEILGA